MKDLKQAILALAFAIAVTATYAQTLAQTTAPSEVRATIDASKTYAPISPNLYGMFIEHAGNLVYSGMWAELIGDRKFYYHSRHRLSHCQRDRLWWNADGK